MESIPRGRNRATTMTRHQSGKWAEQQARRWLTAQGLRFVDANKRYRGGELDLIMRDGLRWIFIEVRYRRNDKFGGAATSVTMLKQHRVRHAAGWLAGWLAG